jgi:hypothetical protein
MSDPDEARISKAVEMASEAFWVAFAAQFPEVSSGDLDPLSTVQFEDGVERAAREWLSANWPEHAASR